jgi:16S rRNA (uracil1498-N3)-methyltransferase
MKQSGRSVLPPVAELTGFREFLDSVPETACKLVAHTDHPRISLDSAVDAAEVVVCIGPEGGFTDEELDLAAGAGFRVVSLGPRRLRTETAALAVAARILA